MISKSIQRRRLNPTYYWLYAGIHLLVYSRLMESHGPESRNDSNLTLTLNHSLRFTPSGASVTLIQIHTHPFRGSVNRIQIQIHSVQTQSLVIQSQIQRF